MSLVPRIKLQKNILKYLLKDIWKVVHSYMQYEDAQIFYESFNFSMKQLERPIMPVFNWESDGMVGCCHAEHWFKNIENFYIDDIPRNAFNEFMEFVYNYSIDANILIACGNCRKYVKLEFMFVENEILVKFRITMGRFQHKFLCDCSGYCSNVYQYYPLYYLKFFLGLDN
jgi:hypothetical protein